MGSPTLGERIHALRLDADKTLAALASEAALSVSYLNDIEHDRTVPSLGKLQQIAEALRLNASELLSGVHPFGTSAWKG